MEKGGTIKLPRATSRISQCLCECAFNEKECLWRDIPSFQKSSIRTCVSHLRGPPRASYPSTLSDPWSTHDHPLNSSLLQGTPKASKKREEVDRTKEKQRDIGETWRRKSYSQEAKSRKTRSWTKSCSSCTTKCLTSTAS